MVTHFGGRAHVDSAIAEVTAHVCLDVSAVSL